MGGKGLLHSGRTSGGSISGCARRSVILLCDARGQKGANAPCVAGREHLSLSLLLCCLLLLLPRVCFSRALVESGCRSL